MMGSMFLLDASKWMKSLKLYVYMKICVIHDRKRCELYFSTRTHCDIGEEIDVPELDYKGS